MRRAVFGGLAALAAAAAVAGCGSTASTRITSNSLTIYTSLPLRGERAAESLAVLRGEKLALQEYGGRIGELKLGLVALDDADPENGVWAPGQAAANARQAARNPSTIAYIGELDSGATAVSLPITNETGVLQVSPLSPHPGLTRVSDKGEPDKYYPSAERTFARLVPSSTVEVDALAKLLSEDKLGAVAIATDGRQDGLAVLRDLRRALRAARATVTAVVRVDPSEDDFKDAVADLTEKAPPEAVVYAGSDPEAGAALLKAVHEEVPTLPLFATGGVARPPFAKDLGSASRVLKVTSPMLPLAETGAAATAFARRFRTAFGAEPPPEAAYGYEAMRSVLQAVRDAGAGGNDRQAVIKQYMATKHTGTVLGDYDFDRYGDTSDKRIGLYTVSNGELRFDRVLYGGSD